MIEKPITTIEDVKKQFAAEIKAGEEKARAEGREEARTGATGLGPGVATAERLGERARALQASDPTLSNVAAVKRAYQEAGVSLE